MVIGSLYLILTKISFKGLSPVHPKNIKTYFINKNYDFRNPLCQTCPDIECLFAEGSFRIPEETTICVRSVHIY